VRVEHHLLGLARMRLHALEECFAH
jgi:hypothetical protein